jgi:hypothetical protein
VSSLTPAWRIASVRLVCCETSTSTYHTRPVNTAADANAPGSRKKLAHNHLYVTAPQ